MPVTERIKKAIVLDGDTGTLEDTASHLSPRGRSLFSLLFSSGQTAVKLSGAEAADRAQCAAPDKPVGY